MADFDVPPRMPGAGPEPATRGQGVDGRLRRPATGRAGDDPPRSRTEDGMIPARPVSIYCDRHPDRVAVLYLAKTNQRLCRECEEHR